MQVWALAVAVAFVVLAAVAMPAGNDRRRLGGVIVRSRPLAIRTNGVRLAIATAVVGAAFATALYVHQRTTIVAVRSGDHHGVYGYPLLAPHRPSWEDPVAVLIAIGGIGLAAGIAAYRPRFAQRSTGA